MMRQLVFVMVALFSANMAMAQNIAGADSSTFFKKNLLGITKHPMAQLLGLRKADPGAVSVLTKSGYRQLYDGLYKVDTGNLNASVNANMFINSVKNPSPFYFSASWGTRLTDTDTILNPTMPIPLTMQWNISKTAVEQLIGKPDYLNSGLPGYIYITYVIPYKNHADSIYKFTFTIKHPVGDTSYNVSWLKGLRIELSTRTEYDAWVDGRNYYKKYGKEKPRPAVAKNEKVPITKPGTNNPPPKTFTDNSRMTPSQYAHLYKDVIVKEGGVSSPAVYAGSSDYTRPLRTFAACARNGYTAYIHLFISDNLQITSSKIERTCGDYDNVNMGSFTLVQTVNGVKVYAAKLLTPSNAPKCQCNYTITAQSNAQFSADMPMFVYYK